MSSVLFVLNATNGGSAVSATELMGGLRQHGFKSYAVVAPSPQNDFTKINPVVEDVAQVPLPWWNKKYRVKTWKRPIHWTLGMAKSGFRGASVARLIRLMRWWDIRVVHSNTSLTLEGAIAARMLGIPHIWHIREEMGDEQLFRWWLPEPVLARTFDELSARIVANSEGTREFFVRNGIGSAVDVVYNGIDMTRFDGPELGRSLRKRWGIGDDEILIGMVANLTSRWKKHEVFVRAAARMARQNSKVRFVIVGFDPDVEGGYNAEIEYTRDLKALSQRLDLGARLQFVGHQSNVPEVMNALDILMHPTDRESFGRVAAEAMAAGKPVVGANAGGLTEIIVPEETGFLISVDDVDAFAQAGLRLVEDDELRAKMGTAGRTRAAGRFALDHTVSQISSLYERALAS